MSPMSRREVFDQFSVTDSSGTYIPKALTCGALHKLGFHPVRSEILADPVETTWEHFEELCEKQTGQVVAKSGLLDALRVFDKEKKGYIKKKDLVELLTTSEDKLNEEELAHTLGLVGAKDAADDAPIDLEAFADAMLAKKQPKPEPKKEETPAPAPAPAPPAAKKEEESKPAASDREAPPATKEKTVEEKPPEAKSREPVAEPKKEEKKAEGGCCAVS